MPGEALQSPLVAIFKNPTSVRNGLNIVNSALELRDKLNNLSRRASLVFLESNKWKWSSLGQQTLEWKDRAQGLQWENCALTFEHKRSDCGFEIVIEKQACIERHTTESVIAVFYVRVNSAIVKAYSCKELHKVTAVRVAWCLQLFKTGTDWYYTYSHTEVCRGRNKCCGCAFPGQA